MIGRVYFSETPRRLGSGYRSTLNDEGPPNQRWRVLFPYSDLESGPVTKSRPARAVWWLLSGGQGEQQGNRVQAKSARRAQLQSRRRRSRRRPGKNAFREL